MAIYGNEGITPTTGIGTVTSADPDPWAVVIQGQVYEAADPQDWVPVGGRCCASGLSTSIKPICNSRSPIGNKGQGICFHVMR